MAVKMENATTPPTPRENFIRALERKPVTGRVPHFELVFFLTMEAFGRVHPTHRKFGQWDQMSRNEQRLHLRDIADLYVHTAQAYEHSAIFIHPLTWMGDDLFETIDNIRDISGDRYFLMTHGDCTFSIPDGTRMCDFAYRIADDPAGLLKDAENGLTHALKRAEQIRARGGLDGFALCSDYCLNTGPFLSPAQFGEFVTPYLTRLNKAYRDMGFYAIKHTDGNIMPILDQLVQSGPHALHSLDPQGGVDLAQVKRAHGNEVCLIGNVNCGLLQTGTEQEVVDDVRRCLRDGMAGGPGFIFSTSNCVYTGLPLERYHLMLDLWREFGNW